MEDDQEQPRKSGPANPVMQAALTACEVAHGRPEADEAAADYRGARTKSTPASA